MKKRLVWTLFILVGATAFLVVAMPFVTLHFGKHYSGSAYGFEKGEEEHYAIEPSENWEVYMYVVLNHNENMYREPVSRLKLASKLDDLPDSVDYSITDTAINGTAQLNGDKTIFEIPSDKALKRMAENMETIELQLSWNDQEETMKLPFLTSFGRRQYPWYLKFMESDFE
ncbi:hypothetical protein ACFO3D_12420 [Virgibacillus kekensis]|uniref:DUF1616 domain-containing protein n=1 Tax=Virgibacillus kekensis TaxID=202261 RepID=A0ABV9DLP6_9BACI